MKPRDQTRLLVVDDNAATRYSTSRILRQGGFTVVEAGSGGEAMARMDGSIELVVLDVNLPDFDGFEVCRRIRARPEIARVPVVHLSATFVQAEDYAHGLESGADGYLTHPIEPIVLIGTVNAFLRTRYAEEEMRASEARFRAVFDRAQSAVALVGADSRYLEVNPAFCRLIGRTRDELVGMETRMLVPERLRDLHEAGDALSTQGDWRGVVPLTHRDGSEVEVEWSSSIHSAPDVRLAIGLDITDRRRLERDRERLLASEQAARAEAERANRLKDEFLATLSHELRNPLNAILGWSQMLARNRTEPDLIKGLQTIERNARVQAQLISDLLDVSRITSGKLRLELDTLDPELLVENALHVVSPTADAKGVQLRRELVHGNLRVLGDPSRLQQVVWNLVTNAIKFTPKGGNVLVSTRRTDSSFQLVVEDDGCGISQEFLPHIFERFRQEDATSRRSHTGLGLGLSIVKHLVEMHGGTVSALSPGEGAGSTFVVTLPLTRVAAKAVDTAHDAASVHGSPRPLAGVKALVVEDDADARELVCRVLAEAGAETLGAADVAAASMMVEAERPSILVSDIGMAQRDGYDLIRELRERGHAAQQLPAIALTAFARMEDRRDALLAGYQMHLTKPVDPQELVAAVVALTGRGGKP